MKKNPYTFHRNLKENLIKRRGEVQAKKILKQIEATEIFDITYKSQNYNVNGFHLYPKYATEKLPVIIYNRGGSKDYGIIDFRIIINLLIPLALSGFSVFCSQYTGNAGSEGKDECGGKEDIQSVIDLYECIKESEISDESKISMWGDSRGGMMTYILINEVNWIKSGVINCAPTDIENNYKLRLKLKEFRRDMYDVDSGLENKKRSALYLVDKFPKNVPLIIFHGTKDDRAPLEDTLKLALELSKAGIDYNLHILDDQHCLPLYKKFVLERGVDFIKKNL